MKLETLIYLCANCHTRYERPALSEGVYGEFLLWSKNGSVVYLNALEDPTYKEVASILLENPQLLSASTNVRARILQDIYGLVACDPDDVGSQYEIEASPPCPNCGQQRPKSWEYSNPPKTLDLSLTAVKHEKWQALSTAEKRERVFAHITK